MEANTTYAGISKIHQIHVSLFTIRREESDCDGNAILCSDGGCCPTGFLCGGSSLCVDGRGSTLECGIGGHFLCPSATGSGSCCPVGFECGDDGGCIAQVTSTSELPNAGRTTIAAFITVQAMEPSVNSGANRQHLTKGEIGGIVGGVLGLVVLLGITVWLIMRRLNEVLRFIRSQPSLEQVNDSDEAPNKSLTRKPTVPDTHDHGPPLEFWDPHSEGQHPNTTRELAGSYEAHGISEMGVNEKKATP
ncbi:hypothetical protein O1611_g5232 [Lasiodiplodia mahajangana]|uniref:Uncharacterized protein n=1 Tax=Lasiodiplodia mahajangana TaxID=1108764 RepID=A0ACC2JM12_9PEZI|nr:hypothetical protein O1611_g5232 [Lasiodiplodia mahajangana]